MPRTDVAARVLAWCAFAVCWGWSIWFGAARLWPEQCRVDGCAARARDDLWAALGAMLAAVALCSVALALTRRDVDATPRRIIGVALIAGGCLVVAMAILGGVFPAARPPVYGE